MPDVTEQTLVTQLRVAASRVVKYLTKSLLITIAMLAGTKERLHQPDQRGF